MRFCNGVDEKLQHYFIINTEILAIASQKLVSQVVLPYKSIHNKGGIFSDETVLIFFMKTIAQLHVRWYKG